MRHHEVCKLRLQEEDTFHRVKYGTCTTASRFYISRLRAYLANTRNESIFTWKVFHLLQIYPRLWAAPYDVDFHPLLGTSHFALHWKSETKIQTPRQNVDRTPVSEMSIERALGRVVFD